MKYAIIILIILFLLIFLLIVSIKKLIKQNREKRADNKINQRSISDLCKTITPIKGVYIAGYPNMDKKMNKISFRIFNGNVEFYEHFTYLFSLPAQSITDIKVDNATTIQNNVTFARLMLVGIFAFAWRKKKKNELAYLSVLWKDGQFDQSLLFEYEVKNSIGVANADRNKMIEKIKTA